MKESLQNKSLRSSVFEYVKDKYKTEPEYLWMRFPNYAVFRHEDDRKWYGLIMDVPKSNIGLQGDERADILNVKLEDVLLRDLLIQQEGYLPGYHISRGNWVSILLDGTVSFDEICRMIDLSYSVTLSKKNKNKIRPPKEWIIPANPKYYDIEHAFDNTEIIYWKQSGSIKKDDTVFMYIAAPVSAILYKCKVVESDIPYNFEDDNLSIKALMKIKLLKEYDSKRFTFDILKNEFGIFAVRGARGVPKELSEALKG